jgi:hypothetical protein
MSYASPIAKVTNSITMPILLRIYCSNNCYIYILNVKFTTINISLCLFQSKTPTSLINASLDQLALSFYNFLIISRILIILSNSTFPH